ncbi:MAG: S9 family peptidase [Bacteroidota bacterium]
MQKLLYLLIIAISLSPKGYSQNKKPITHETMWLMKRVAAPVVSPDGKWVVFSLTDPSYDEKEQSTDLWLTAADGSGKPRKITNTKAGESAYTWSPDSKQIAFVAKREGDEVAQVYLLDVTGPGEAQRFTNLSTGAGAPQYSPDGKMLLFTSSVYPGAFTDSANKKAAEDKKKIKYKARVYTSFPVSEWDHWLDEKQTHALIQALDATTARDIFSGSDMSTKEGFLFSGNASWSSDSKEIIFSASENTNTSAYQNSFVNLYKVAAAGGVITKLLGDGSDYTGAKQSADSKYLFCYVTANNNYKVYNINNLLRYDWPSMQNKAVLTAGLDRPVSSYSVNGNTVYMNVEDQGLDKIYTVPVSGGKAQLLSTATKGCFTNMSVSQNASPVIIGNYESSTMPPEIVRTEANGNFIMLTSFNAEKLAAIDFQTAEPVWFKSSRGKMIKSLLVRPAGFDPSKKYPLFVQIHGGPAGAWKDSWTYRWNYQLLAAPGYVVLLTDYTGSTGYGEKFSQDIQFDPFKGPSDELQEAATDAIKKFPFIDGSLQVAGGASYGGHLANWLQATTTHYKCLISHAGLVNSESQWGTSDGFYEREVMNGGTPWMNTKTFKEQNPIRFAANFKTPILVTVGELDFRVPLNNSIENWHILQRLKIPSKLIVFPNANHWITNAEDSRFFYKEVQDWMKKYLGK